MLFTPKKFFIPLLALIFLTAASLISCESGGEPEETDKEPAVMVDIFNQETFDYQLVRPEEASQELIDAAVKLRSAFDAVSGSHMRIQSDWFKEGTQEPVDFEVLVGETNRPETAQAIAMLGNRDYTVTFVGTKLVIVGQSPLSTFKAIDYFIAEYLGGGSAPMQSLSLPSDLCDIQRYDAGEGVDAKMLGTLTVDPARVINADIIGGGVNFDFSSYVFFYMTNGGEWNVRSQHLPFSFIDKQVDTMWKEFFQIIDFSGMQYVRLNVSFTMWEPINDNDDPFITDFERGFAFSPGFAEREEVEGYTGEEIGFPTNNYLYIKALYRLLDHFEKRGLYVILANWDNGSEATGFCPAGYNWMATRDADGNQLGRGSTLNVISPDEYAETFAAVMYHLIEEKGYSCVRGFTFYNEPEQLINMNDVLVTCYNAFGAHLTRLGIRDKVKIQAFDGPVFWSVSDNTVENRIEVLDRLCGDNMDIIGIHHYLSTLNSGEKIEGNDVRGTAGTYLLDWVKNAVAQSGERPVIVSELGTFAFNNGAGDSSAKDFRSRLFAAEAAAEIFNGGAKGYGLWVFNCYLHQYYTMLDYDTEDTNRLIPDSVNYYPSSLIMKFLPAGTDIVYTGFEGCSDGDSRYVTATAGVLPSGELTVMLVNNSDSPAAITLKGIAPGAYNLLRVTDEVCDRIIVDDPLAITVDSQIRLEPRSINIITTCEPGNGVVFDD